MAASALQLLTPGRGPGAYINASLIEITVAASATVYANAGGGLPIDLAPILQQAAPAGWSGPQGIQTINPLDIVAVLPKGVSTNGFMAVDITIGTPLVATTPPGMSPGNATASPGFITSCPASIRLQGGAGFAQPADGAVTDSFTCFLVVNRNGANY